MFTEYGLIRKVHLNGNFNLGNYKINSSKRRNENSPIQKIYYVLDKSPNNNYGEIYKGSTTFKSSRNSYRSSNNLNNLNKTNDFLRTNTSFTKNYNMIQESIKNRKSDTPRITRLSKCSVKESNIINMGCLLKKFFAKKNSQFENCKSSKMYSVSNETKESNGKNYHRLNDVINYESSSFNMINHSKGKGRSITEMLKSHPKACYRVNPITKFHDKSHVGLNKSNIEYNKRVKMYPLCFLKTNELCTNQCNLKKSYGPHFNLFK